MENLVGLSKILAFKVVPVLILLFFTLKILIFFFEEKLIFFPYRGDTTPRPETGFKEVTIEAEDRVRIHGWCYRDPAPGPFILFFHGNAGDLRHREDFLITLRDYGVSFLAIDYRGYGKSGGSASERGILLDARASYKWLVEEEGIEPGRVVPFGRSIGSHPALEIAATSEVGGLIVEGTFTSIVDVAARIYFFLPVRWLMRTEFDNAGRIGRVGVPKLFIHAAEDEIIHPSIGRRLYDLAPEPKELYIVEGAGHNDTPYVGGKEYYDRIDAFLQGLKTGD